MLLADDYGEERGKVGNGGEVRCCVTLLGVQIGKVPNAGDKVVIVGRSCNP